MRILILLSGLLLSAAVSAESVLPSGCQAIAVQGESLTLQAKKNKIIFIHNITQHDLWITHPASDQGASAGWSSRLQSSNWSALALDKGPFELSCIESRPGHEQQIPCEGAIEVCQWDKVKFPENSKGTFWASEDMSLSALTATIGGRGFILSKTKE